MLGHLHLLPDLPYVILMEQQEWLSKKYRGLYVELSSSMASCTAEPRRSRGSLVKIRAFRQHPPLVATGAGPFGWSDGGYP